MLQLNALLAVCLIPLGALSQDVEFTADSLIAPGQNGTFTCESEDQSLVIEWELTIKNVDPPIMLTIEPPSVPLHVSLNLSFLEGVFFDVDGAISRITIEGSHASNLTTVECFHSEGELVMTRVNHGKSELRVFDHPTMPTDLQVDSVEEDEILFSWSPSFSPFSVQVTYQVEVENGNGDKINSKTTNLTSFLQSRPESCSTLIFKIYALNSAGKSNESYIVYSEPNTSGIANSIRHTLEFLNGEITLSIHFNPVMDCSEYPVTHYLLTLSMSDETFFQEQTTSNSDVTFAINSSYISEDTEYSYIVEAVNALNISSAIKAKEFLTTDVQTAMAVISNRSVTVNCSFISGSQSSGCHVVVRNSTTDISCNISRLDGSAFTSKEIRIDFAQEVLVYDWEKDESIGNLLIPVTMSTTAVTMAPMATLTTSGTTAPTAGFPYLATAVPGGVVITFLLLLIIVMCCVKVIHNKRGTKNTSDSFQGAAVLNKYKSTSNGAHFKESRTSDGSIQLEQEYSQLNRPSLQVDTFSQVDTYSQIDMNVIDPVYQEVANAIPPTRTRTDSCLSQLGVERTYAVLERNPSPIHGNIQENAPPIPGYNPRVSPIKGCSHSPIPGYSPHVSPITGCNPPPIPGHNHRVSPMNGCSPSPIPGHNPHAISPIPGHNPHAVSPMNGCSPSPITGCNPPPIPGHNPHVSPIPRHDSIPSQDSHFASPIPPIQRSNVPIPVPPPRIAPVQYSKLDFAT